MARADKMKHLALPCLHNFRSLCSVIGKNRNFIKTQETFVKHISTTSRLHELYETRFSRQIIEEQSLDLLKNVLRDKNVKADLTMKFTDMGLDSIDLVELIVSAEEQFGLDIDIEIIDKSRCPQDIVEHIIKAKGLN